MQTPRIGKNIMPTLRRTKCVFVVFGRHSWSSHWKRGFTLLEMIVSTGLFTVLVIIAIGIMLTVSRAQLKSSGTQATLDNIRYTLELIAKEMQTGSSFTITSDCVPAGQTSEISFINPAGEERKYFLGSDGTIRQALSLTLTSDKCVDNSFAIPLTSSEVTVQYLRFELHGQNSSPSDGQPVVTISLGVILKNAKSGFDTPINLQTTVVQRTREL